MFHRHIPVIAGAARGSRGRAVSLAVTGVAALATVGLAGPALPVLAAPAQPAGGPGAPVVMSELEVRHTPPGFAAVELAGQPGDANDGLAPGLTLSLAGETTVATMHDEAIPFVTVSVQPLGDQDANSVLDGLATRPGSEATKVRGNRAVKVDLADPWDALSFAVDGKLVTVAGRDVSADVLADVGNGIERAAGRANTLLPSPRPHMGSQPPPPPPPIEEPDAITALASAERGQTPWQQYFANACSSSSPRDSVRAIQGNVWAHGYNITLDGVYGTNTKNAIAGWQSRHGLTADGCAGFYTKERMYNGSFTFRAADNTLVRQPYLRFTSMVNYYGDNWAYQSVYQGRWLHYRTWFHDFGGEGNWQYDWHVNHWGTWYCIRAADGRGC